MDTYNLRGKVTEIWDTNVVSEKFKKREFVVEVNNRSERGTYIEYIKMQLVMNNCDLLDGIQKGDIIAVQWTLMGRRWKKDDKNVYFTNVEARDITVVSRIDGTGTEDTIEDQYPIEPEDDIMFPAKFAPAPADDEPDDLPF